jgi:hypothetical protein
MMGDACRNVIRINGLNVATKQVPDSISVSTLACQVARERAEFDSPSGSFFFFFSRNNSVNIQVHVDFHACSSIQVLSQNFPTDRDC